MRREGRFLVRWSLLSLAGHASVLALVPSPSPMADARPPVLRAATVGPAWIELAAAPVDALSLPPPPLPGGPRSPQNIEGEKPGGGGDRSGSAEAVLLASEASDVTLSDRARTATISQIPRLATDRSRASRWDARSTPHPAHDVFLASGSGRRPERRPTAASPPRAGARTRSQASGPGQPGRPGPEPASALLASLAAPPAVSTDPGSRQPSRGAGAIAATGLRATVAADVAMGRPEVDRGVPSVPARDRAPRPRDRVDSESLSAPLVRSFVDASQRQGRTTGTGSGGSGSSLPPGTGSDPIEGGHAFPSMPGPGREPALDLAASRYRTWHAQAAREIGRHLAYPRARRLARDQGDAVYRVTLRRDGTLAGAPRLLRSSGFDDLDRAAREAIERARFASLPIDLAPESARVAVTFPVRFVNPMSY